MRTKLKPASILGGFTRLGVRYGLVFQKYKY